MDLGAKHVFFREGEQLNLLSNIYDLGDGALSFNIEKVYCGGHRKNDGR